MRVIVITGGLGSGKSTAAQYLATKGAVALDLDEVAAKLMGPGSSLLARVAEEFEGTGILSADGRLDRAALADVAFATPQAVERLNAIVHPAVAHEVGESIDMLRLMPQPPLAVILEVPLLAEAPVFGELADGVIALVAPEDIRVRRALDRGMAKEDARRRIRHQATDAERAALSDRVIVNDGSEERLFHELNEFWEEFVAIGGASS
jgi:dephospho-CoA kinase